MDPPFESGAKFFQCPGMDMGFRTRCDRYLRNGTRMCPSCCAEISYSADEEGAVVRQRVMAVAEDNPDVRVSVEEAKALLYMEKSGKVNIHLHTNTRRKLKDNLRKVLKAQEEWMRGKQNLSAEKCRAASSEKGQIPGLDGIHRTAPWKAVGSADLPMNADVVLRDTDVRVWLTWALFGESETCHQRNSSAHQLCFDALVDYDGEWVQPFLECFTLNTPSAFADPFLDWWSAQASAPDGPQRLQNKPPTDQHRRVFREAVRFAMGKYTALGAVWAPR